MYTPFMLIFTAQSACVWAWKSRNTACKEDWRQLHPNLLTRVSHDSNYDNGIIHKGREVQ